MGLIKEGSSAVPQPPVTASDYEKASQHQVDNYQQNGGDAKGRQIKVSGVIQAAVQCSVLQMFCTSPEEHWHLVEKLADKMLDYIDRKSK